MSRKIIHEVPASYLVAAVLQSDVVLGQIQRELYRVLPGVTIEQLRQMLRDELLQRNLVQGAYAEQAEALLRRIAQLRAQGLTATQTFQAVTGAGRINDDEETYRILIEDKRDAGRGG